MSVGRRLREARQGRGYPPRVVCKYLKLTLRALQGYERGERSVPYELVRLMAYLYDVPIGWLVDGEGEAPSYPRVRLTREERLQGCASMPSAEARFNARWRERPGPGSLPRA